MENFSTVTKSFFECWRTNWQNHELLESDWSVRVRTTVDDVHHWSWKNFSVESTKVAVKWDFKVVSSSTSYSDRHTKDCVRTQFTFVRSTVKSDHSTVDSLLITYIVANDSFSNDVVYVVNSFLCTKTTVTRFVTVAKFNCFVFTSRSS